MPVSSPSIFERGGTGDHDSSFDEDPSVPHQQGRADPSCCSGQGLFSPVLFAFEAGRSLEARPGAVRRSGTYITDGRPSPACGYRSISS
jgi:hypothetical protein